MSCPHCGSQSVPFSDYDRTEYCMNCNRGSIRPYVEAFPMTEDMLQAPQHHKTITFICKNKLENGKICGKVDTKAQNSTRKVCRDCQRAQHNATCNTTKYRQLYFVSNTITRHDCCLCHTPIKGRQYKKRHHPEWACEKCVKVFKSNLKGKKK